jgi:hypothetical protein
MVKIILIVVIKCIYNNVCMIVTEKLLLSCIHFANIITMWMMYVYQGK